MLDIETEAQNAALSRATENAAAGRVLPAVASANRQDGRFVVICQVQLGETTFRYILDGQMVTKDEFVAAYTAG